MDNNNNPNNNNPNNNNNNNNNDYNKCHYHPTNEINLICLEAECKLMPCCVACMSISGKHHRHSFDLVNNCISKIIDNFKKIYPNISKRINDYKELSEKSNSIHSNSKLDFYKNIALNDKVFANLINTLSSIQRNIKNELQTNQDKNYELNSNESLLITNNSQILSNILNNVSIDHLDDSINNDNNDNINLVKYYQQSLEVLNDEIIEIDYQNSLLTFDLQLIEELKENFKKIYSINQSDNINIEDEEEEEDEKFKIGIDENGNGFVKNENKKYYIYSENSEQEDKDSVAFGEDCGNLLNIRSNRVLKNVMLLDGFKESLGVGVLPDSIEYLEICDIKTPLVVGSIPSSVRTLVLNDGFSQPLEPGIIPSSVKSLDLHNIKNRLNVGSIPRSVENLVLNNGFNQPLLVDVVSLISDGVKFLTLHKIKSQLKVGSIPKTVKKLSIGDGFSQYLESGIVPNGVITLYINNIKQQLQIGSIPTSVKFATFGEGFSQLLSPGIIPKGVMMLFFYNIKCPLVIGSIPISVTWLTFYNGFNHSISPGIISKGVERLLLHDIKQPLEMGSIPTTVTHIVLEDGFKQALTPGIIPNSIKELTLKNVNLQLVEGSIPRQIPRIILNNFNESLENYNNNNKCSFHPNKNLELLCFNCKFIPCCMHCISQHGEHHGHKTNCIDSIETSNILKMMNLFKNDIIPKLKEIVENDKQIINKSENIYNEINQQYENNKILVTNEFKKFHTLIQINQLDIENQLRTTFDENTIIYTIINSSINNNNNYNINDDNNYGINIESIGNKLDNLNDTHLQYYFNFLFFIHPFFIIF
ncbi:hypothetical protein DDB_G0290679 [Dictyostelium discoideum AX4]|uniref:B box-type domain-containing protein n=1 Tax=Dictyostelium discoideum TaxID=44689 RepID=Q54FT0_DICDI|nr:hypothetical protein DDB_G0290679 [Dictyostelium discoideum AX4]EAL62200.1 hypothetical protein DDB_G0290679 [Dictyostelium discoideum AX4]|eukprot:XP_635687.1 hypothetical protein DDB_G0290679 [Dictyostelium discoideum AX4]